MRKSQMIPKATMENTPGFVQWGLESWAGKWQIIYALSALWELLSAHPDKSKNIQHWKQYGKF